MAKGSLLENSANDDLICFRNNRFEGLSTSSRMVWMAITD